MIGYTTAILMLPIMRYSDQPWVARLAAAVFLIHILVWVVRLKLYD
jgi:hypothetical protein